MFVQHCTNDDLNLRRLIHGHHTCQNECFVRTFSLHDYEGLHHNFCILHRFKSQNKTDFEINSM